MENKKTNNTPMANDSKKEFVVNYHMNEFCNYSCEYCYAKWGIGDLKKEIHNDLDKVEILLNSLYGFFSKMFIGDIYSNTTTYYDLAIFLS